MLRFAQTLVLQSCWLVLSISSKFNNFVHDWARMFDWTRSKCFCNKSDCSWANLRVNSDNCWVNNSTWDPLVVDMECWAALLFVADIVSMVYFQRRWISSHSLLVLCLMKSIPRSVHAMLLPFCHSIHLAPSLIALTNLSSLWQSLKWRQLGF